MIPVEQRLAAALKALLRLVEAARDNPTAVRDVLAMDASGLWTELERARAALHALKESQNDG